MNIEQYSEMQLVQFCERLFLMSWFNKSAVVEVEAPPIENVDEIRLAEVEQEWRIREAEFNEAYRQVKDYNATHPDPRAKTLGPELFVRVGAMTMELERQGLESALTRAAQLRTALLQERAALRFKLGLSK